MCVSGVEGGRYGPGAATAASEASPFFLQAFLPPPRFTLSATPFPARVILFLPLNSLLFSVSISLPFSVNFSPFLPLSFSLSLSPSLSFTISLSPFLSTFSHASCLSFSFLSRSFCLSYSLPLSFSPCHTLSIHPARSAISPSGSPPTQRVPATTDTPPVQPASVPRSSSSFHPLCLPVTPSRCHSHAAGNRADPA